MRSAKTFAAVVFVLLWALSWKVCGWAQEVDPWQSYRNVVGLELPRWTGSGTLVATSGSKALILSCRHVNPRRGMVVTVNWRGLGAKTQGVVDYVERGRGFSTDLAVVITDLPAGATPQVVSKFDPAKGPWRSVGYRNGRFLEAFATEAEQKGSLIYLNSPYMGGQSGGPTFDSQGRVVAVVVASDGKTVGVSVDGAVLHKMLQRYAR